MKKYKTQCEALVESGAIILVCDGFGENGTPIYVTRKVTGCYGVKCGRDSMWEVTADKAFSDGATGVSYRMIKGANVNGKISYEGLMNDMIRYDHITPERKVMIISDARVRLGMAGEDNERYKGQTKLEEALVVKTKASVEKLNLKTCIVRELVEMLRRAANSIH